MSWGIRPRGCYAPRYCKLADDPYTFLNKHKHIELQRVEGSGVQKQRSVVIEDIGCADSIPLVPYKTKSNVE
ncbi:unnamed protein product [Prunus armeniaca]|uniref:Uncharacterized protein n=1 Tax=Prunus armeniaca TaxID=36596 RepID=A0A6J5UPX1_PRUAR|nr:unnamed protein product [Prunus armeniaca]CAB4308964.1 unnamed protein product [Prunus armeniaca]